MPVMTKSDAWRVVAALCLVLLCLSLAIAPAVEAGKPPTKKTYFTILLGLGDPYESAAECLRFKGKSLCTADGLCGSWERTGDATFDFEIGIEDETPSVAIIGEMRFEDQGAQSSIAGTARLKAGVQITNFGLTGRAVKSKKCPPMVRAWDRTMTPNQPFQDGDCLLRANERKFGQPDESLYVLPFPPGTEYYLSQTYCYLFSTHRNEFAYDFDLPLGDQIVAARAGKVIELVEDRANDSPHPDANYLKVRHSDNTVAHYIHVMHDSVVPAVGDEVEQGEVIARSAMSGTIEPHLHFVVFRNDPPVEGDDVPVNFSNCDGEIDPLGGLIQDQTYRAEGS